jgi:hypothetical protein
MDHPSILRLASNRYVQQLLQLLHALEHNTQAHVATQFAGVWHIQLFFMGTASWQILP